MKPQFFLIPYFIGQFEPGLDAIVSSEWKVIQPATIASTDPLSRMSILYSRLAQSVTEAITMERLPVSVSGDCLSSIGMFTGLQQAGLEPCLIWFDAHGDFHTWETTQSNFIGGMPLAMITGRGDLTILENLGTKPIPEDSVIITDARDLDPGEDEALAASGITHIANISEMLELRLPEAPLYIHFDADVIDPGQAPAMRYKSPDGPSVELLRKIFRRLSSTNRIVGVSVSAWDSKLDVDGKSRDVTMGLLRELI